jgi:hypothetical protein
MSEVGEGGVELSLLPSGVPVTVMLVTGSIPGGNNCGGGTEGTDEGHPDGIADDDCWVPLLLCGEVGRGEDKQLASGGKTFDGPEEQKQLCPSIHIVLGTNQPSCKATRTLEEASYKLHTKNNRKRLQCLWHQKKLNYSVY